MRPDDLDDAMKRTRGYWYDDGLSDIAVGVVFLLIGLLNYVQTILPPGFARGSLAAIGLPVVVLGGYFLGSKLVRVAKERITYPRTGYVQYQRPPRKIRPLVALLGAAVSISLTLLITSQPTARALIPALQGIFIGAMMFYIGYWAGVARYYALGALSVVIGAAVALAGFSDDVFGNAVYFAATGASLVVSGLATLAVYLRRTAPPTEG